MFDILTKLGGLGTVAIGHLLIKPRRLIPLIVLEGNQTQWYFIDQEHNKGKIWVEWNVPMPSDVRVLDP